MKGPDRWLFYGLILIVIWVPFPFGSNRGWAWSLMELMTFTLFLTWYIKFGIRFNVDYIKPYKPLLYLIAFVQLWVLIQLIPLPMDLLNIIAPNTSQAYQLANVDKAPISLDPARTQMQLLKGVAYLMIMFLVLVLVTSRERLKILLYAMVFAGIFQAMYGSLFVLTGADALFYESKQYSGTATGTFVYKNHFANFLMMSLSIGIGLLVASLTSTKTKDIKRSIADMIDVLLSPKALMRMSLILMVIALVLSRSRMGNTAFFAAMSLVSVFALIFMKQKTRGLLWLFGSMLVIDIFIVSSWFGLENVKQRLVETSIQGETRDEVVRYGLELVEKFPITGTGHGSFLSVFPSVKGPGVNMFYNFAHNEYLQFAIELGIPVTLLLGFLVLWSLWHAQYALRHRRRSLMKGTAFAAMMAIVGQLIHITVDFTLQPPANALYFLIIICLDWMSRFSKFSSSSASRDKIRHNSN